MKNYSPLLTAFKLALICGATLSPLNQASAQTGWNDIVDALEDKTPAHLKRLKDLIEQKQTTAQEAGIELNERWRGRVTRFARLNDIQNMSLEQVKKLLKDNGRFKTRDAQVVNNADHQMAVVSSVAATQPSVVKLVKRSHEAKIKKNEIEANKQKAPSAVVAKGSRNVEEEIQAIEGVLTALPDEDRKGYERFLSTLKIAKDRGITHFKDEDDLNKQVISNKVNTDEEEAANNSPEPQDTYKVTTSRINVEEQLANLHIILGITEEDREKSSLKAQIKKLQAAQAAGVTDYADEQELNHRLPEYEDNAPAMNNAPPQEPESIRFSVLEQIQVLTAMLVDADQREASAIKAQLGKLQRAQEDGVEFYENEEELKPYMPPAAPRQVIYDAPQVVDVRQADNIIVAEQIVTFQEILNGMEGDDRGQYEELLRLHQAASNVGIVSYRDQDDFMRQLGEKGLLRQQQPNHNGGGLYDY